MAIIKCEFSKQLEKFDNWLNKQYLNMKVFFYNKFNKNKNKKLFLYKDNKINGIIKMVPYYDSNKIHIGYDINISYFLFKDTKNKLYKYLNTIKRFKILYSTSLNNNTSYESLLQLRLRYFLKPEDKKFPKEKFLDDFNEHSDIFYHFLSNTSLKESDINLEIIINKFQEYIIREEENYNFILINHLDILECHFNKYSELDSKVISDEFQPAYKKLCKISHSFEERYYKDGLLHREDGPAWVENYQQKYYKNGELHREDGPAIINEEKEEYYLHNKKIKPKNFKRIKLNYFLKSSKIYFNFE